MSGTDKRQPTSPEDLVYQSCYAPAELAEFLETAENRSRIRRLPVGQLYFGTLRLDRASIARLLPHITEEQWQGMVDLDIWEKDKADLGRLLNWQSRLLEASDPVARKLFRALDPELWSILFKHELKIEVLSEDSREDAAWGREEALETPDKQFRIHLPSNPEKAKLLRDLVSRLYELEQEDTAVLLENSLWRTTAELEEECYQGSRRRLESLGFQDYFNALEVYTPLAEGEPLPLKRKEGLKEVSVLPLRVPRGGVSTALFLLRGLGRVTDQQELRELLEELFFICNKVLSADRISPAAGEALKKGIRKTIGGVNLGLELYTLGNEELALEAIRAHYFQSLFQLSFGRLSRLRERAQKVVHETPPEPGSLEEEKLEHLCLYYPEFLELVKGRPSARFFETKWELEAAETFLGVLERENEL